MPSQSLPSSAKPAMVNVSRWAQVFLTQSWAGKVDHGFDKKSSAELRERLTPLIRKTPPYTKRIAHKGIWVEPELRGNRVSRQIRRGKVRHPFFKGLREDL